MSRVIHESSCAQPDSTHSLPNRISSNGMLHILRVRIMRTFIAVVVHNNYYSQQ